MKLPYKGVSFGADPEFFFTKGTEVVGSEKIIPKEGVFSSIGNKLIVVDGVQAEFNVPANTCRQSFSHNLRLCFQHLAQQMHGKDIAASFAQTVEVTKDELASLSKESQQFGCAPSKNSYEETKISVKDASKYFYRSAGGHIHVGHNGDADVRAILANTDVIVPLLDILLGNTCVLLDRDPGNVERRKVYGRAGEFRLPIHGLEYRTLSNFWLRSYPLMSLVLGLARFAVIVAANKKARELIFGAVDIKQVQEAINKNDFDLAYENFRAIKSIVADMGMYASEYIVYPLQGARADRFEEFVANGVDAYFQKDVVQYWLNFDWHQAHGWESFADYDVRLKSSTPREVGQPQLVADLT